MRTTLSILTFLLLFSCVKTEIDFERTSLVINDQKFELLTANELFRNYISSKGNYSTDIVNVIEKEYKEQAEYPFILESIKGEIEPNEGLKEFLGKLQPIDFKKMVEPSLRKIITELPGPNTKILFIPMNPAYVDFFRKYQIAVTAITVGSGRIIVSINPTSINWEEQLAYVLAHEYHHSVWTSRNFKTKDFTPLEYLIFEGRADSFAKKLFPDVNNPWTQMIGKSDEKRVWNIIKPELYERDTEMNDLMMIGNEEIPYCSGYTIGFNIVEQFKKYYPEINDSILIDIEPDKILKMSLYD